MREVRPWSLGIIRICSELILKGESVSKWGEREILYVVNLLAIKDIYVIMKASLAEFAAWSVPITSCKARTLATLGTMGRKMGTMGHIHLFSSYGSGR